MPPMYTFKTSVQNNLNDERKIAQNSMNGKKGKYTYLHKYLHPENQSDYPLARSLEGCYRSLARRRNTHPLADLNI